MHDTSACCRTRDRPDAVVYLVERGTDLRLPGEDGHRAVDLARTHNSVEAMELRAKYTTGSNDQHLKLYIL